MSESVNALVIVAVVVWVVVRQFLAQRIDLDRRWWVLPVVLALLVVREPGLLDGRHPVAAATLLGADVVVGLVTGLGWAVTPRVWRAPDGSVWAKGTGATGLVWLGGVAARAGLYSAGAAAGVAQGSGALLLGLAVTLLARGGVLMWRARGLEPTYRDAGRVVISPAAARKDRV
ncbi:DUF1453 domain-containing protein [Streptomyces sp. NPDC101112]|uniref:DUF1453 domain-containing protein n=1 Tax=Streptomyces sp. NPDC101112 TaxID=3366105 RepID=UPI00382C14B0